VFIEKATITNFRVIKYAEIGFSDLTVFLGRNGVGKSTLLYALDSFYNVSAQYSELDYYNHQQTDAEIRISVTYTNLTPEELAEFGSYVQDGKLTITKVINQAGARYFGTVPQILEFAELRKKGANDKRAGLKDLVENGRLPAFPEIPRRSEDVDRVMTEYEASHPGLTAPVERETQFFGPRNIGGGKLDKFTKFVLVPAVRDASTETEKRGAVMQLLDLIVTRSISTREDFKKFKEDFETKARELYARGNLPELNELGQLVTTRLQRYAPGAELIIDFRELPAPSIPLPEALVSVTEDEFRVPIRYSGHGLQRALILALLEQLSLTQSRSQEDAGTGDGNNREERQPLRVPDVILAIEEPELYLHPARSRYLSRILRDLAMPRAGDPKSGTQIMYVTHSPYFVDVARFDEVRMCRKVVANVGEARAISVTSFTRAAAATTLAEVWNERPETFTGTSFAARATPVLNSLVNEGLFADVAVVVEGDSDVSALWAMQEFLGLKWDELGIVVVPVGGKSKIDRAVVSFSGFGIPTYFVFDGDKRKVTGGDNSPKTNRALLRLGKMPEEDCPSTGVYESCAVFEEAIEEYLKDAAGARFTEIRDSAARHCGIDRPSTSLKNPDVMTIFLEASRREGIEFPILRAIVERVTGLARASEQRPPPGS
jgi:hypothetical protein